MPCYYDHLRLNKGAPEAEADEIQESGVRPQESVLLQTRPKLVKSISLKTHFLANQLRSNVRRSIVWDHRCLNCALKFGIRFGEKRKNGS